MTSTVTGFEWDDANREKCRKHGLTREEIESVFQGTVMVLPDPDHSIGEQRFRAIGRTNIGQPNTVLTDSRPAEVNRYVFVVFTLRIRSGQTYIRPISARYMHRKEIDRYEKENSNL
ncbi:MAG: BrnT family toxin [Rhodospirillaceae bacterium]